MVQADVWPEVRAVAATKGSSASIAASAKYLEALLQFAGASCQRTCDATRALTGLLAGSSAAAADPTTNRGPNRSVPDWQDSELVSGPLASLIVALEHPREALVTDSEGDGGVPGGTPQGRPEEPAAASESETTELVAAIQARLQGSRVRWPAARSARAPAPLSAEELESAKPAQVVHAACACNVTDSSSPGEVEHGERPRGLDSASDFMQLAQVSFQLHRESVLFVCT